MNDSPIVKDAEVEELLAEFEGLATFTEVGYWAAQAQAGIERLTSIIRGLDVEIARESQSVEKLKYQNSKKVLGRLFGGNNEEKELTRLINELRASRSGLAHTVARLQAGLDFTPKSPEEQKVLLEELSMRRRQLQEKKREITKVVRSPLMAKPAQAPRQTVFDPATIARRKARYERDEELLPGETTATSLARQRAQIDRDIMHVEKFM